MYIIFDIGGTKMRVAGSKDGIHLGKIVVKNTPQNFNDAVSLLQEVSKEVSGGETIRFCAGGIAGLWNKEKTKLLFSPHLASWVGKNIKGDFEKAIGAKVFLQNDSALVGLGEAVSGSGKDFGIVMYMTVSTGVGGARIVHGKIDQASFGFEPGHQVIDLDKSIDPRHNILGNLEGFVSGTALSKISGKKAVDISQKEPIWETLAETLSFGVYNSILHWSPDVVVLGGSMITGNPSISTDMVYRYLGEINSINLPMPQIKKAVLGDSAGLYGALVYLKQNIN